MSTTAQIPHFSAVIVSEDAGLQHGGGGPVCEGNSTQQNTPFPNQTKHEISHTNTEQLTVR